MWYLAIGNGPLAPLQKNIGKQNQMGKTNIRCWLQIGALFDGGSLGPLDKGPLFGKQDSMPRNQGLVQSTWHARQILGIEFSSRRFLVAVICLAVGQPGRDMALMPLVIEAAKMKRIHAWRIINLKWLVTLVSKLSPLIKRVIQHYQILTIY